MVREAEQWAESDKRRRDEVDRRNEADALAYQAERLLAEHGPRLEPAMRERLESSMTTVKQSLEARDGGELATTVAGLRASLDAAGESIYRAAPPDSGSRPTGGTGEAGEKVVEADFRRGA